MEPEKASPGAGPRIKLTVLFTLMLRNQLEMESGIPAAPPGRLFRVAARPGHPTSALAWPLAAEAKPLVAWGRRVAVTPPCTARLVLLALASGAGVAPAAPTGAVDPRGARQRGSEAAASLGAAACSMVLRLAPPAHAGGLLPPPA